jgi:DNA-binding MarR family transcriptional regulator
MSAVAQEEGLTQVTLVERTASDANTVTALLGLLERRGLVRRESHATDRRARCVFLTTQGKNILRKAAKVSGTLLDTLCGCVEVPLRSQAEQALRRIHAVFSESPAGANGRVRRSPR